LRNPIRVAHIGNTANVAYYYSHLMNRYNIESTVFQPKNPTIDMNAIYYGYESGNPLGVDLQFYEREKRVFSFRKIANMYDIIELHEGGGFLAPFLRNTSAKKIGHFHGSELRLATIRKRLLHVAFRLAKYDHLLLSTPDLRNFIWDKKAEVLLNPVDPSLSLKDNLSGNYLFYPTRVDDEVKGSNYVFESWPLIKKVYPDLKLLAVRWGVDADKYESLTNRDESIVWLDVLNRSEYSKILGGAKIVLGQFNLESLGLVEQEAISIGKPVLCLGTMKTNNPEKIAQESINILNDQKYKTEVYKVQKQLLAPYDPNTLSKQLYEIYLKVLD
jgi:glycosyltransferase involved in cell wall biosynthesis